MKLTRLPTAFTLFLAAVCVADEKPEKQNPAVQIRSLLASRCLECHSGAKPKGELDLSRKEGWTKGGESGSAVAPGKPEKSLAWQRVSDNEMPPKHPLTKSEKTLLKSWIERGAKWQGGPIDRFRLTTDARAGYDWWALRRLKTITPPPVANRRWVRNEIDQFVLRRLAARSLTPAGAASPRALLRRLHFDLTGLPPTSAEVEAFVRDPSDTHYGKIVDRLLDSPHYGERWGRHWLDVVRFGESDGFERNNPRKNSWHYRDWVIQSLNDDMPYDEFVRLQLAGDVLKPGPQGSAAVGFLVAGVDVPHYSHSWVIGHDRTNALIHFG